ncbi:hypothetical protein [Vibrio natriegens]|uniref:KfrA N-terminal DNA-binding domain-containing protein n=1 Tax=Vibrio natriegens NBRC 15636 = ATCC 14048 = DSM 759 TaxID=1219067 RepID=A0AAN0Y364_VIBNA|nr:hypothetical protein [Vibrio natriegens]ALR14848.1 hypothetical protein PN96_02220 [Vibrio natriegens NBRC 15636 = ATCC 14048 = DSM 759]ANQ13288.1 hypothetical protein BA890_11055 [Vibrio natriegens NBRC 15636 = ATCC 14048 = DSM 759]EPM39937.1 hypothetical protein M272_03785 [Vibrio natriegens NBRC 15636 = ATCC 14048 = DSM 759]MDX6027720.1 hypothetical protein [Vibrio natriegens NBRC 15636 = ATCC 14048 = DSM 759]UUI11029.1 hypothetical protein NP431_11175 [Vibrio natriegens]
MLTQDVTKELETVMEQLQQEGKEPSVALVKARMKTPVPMPALITALKSWKSANRVPKIEIVAQKTSEQDRLAMLENTIAQLTARIEELEKKLSEKKS